LEKRPVKIIPSDELIQPPVRTEAQKNVNKSLRYVVHNENVLDKDDRHHAIEVESRTWKTSLAGLFDLGTNLTLNGGFVNHFAGLRVLTSLRHMTVHREQNIRT